MFHQLCCCSAMLLKACISASAAILTLKFNHSSLVGCVRVYKGAVGWDARVCVWRITGRMAGWAWCALGRMEGGGGVGAAVCTHRVTVGRPECSACWVEASTCRPTHTISYFPFFLPLFLYLIYPSSLRSIFSSHN